MNVVIEKRNRHGEVVATRHVTGRWVKDNADWMKAHGFTVQEKAPEQKQEPAVVAETPALSVPEVIQVPDVLSETVTDDPQAEAAGEEAPQETKPKRKSKKTDE